MNNKSLLTFETRQGRELDFAIGLISHFRDFSVLNGTYSLWYYYGIARGNCALKKNSVTFSLLRSLLLCYTWGQFHQHFSRAFFVRIFCQSQNVTRKSCRNEVRTKNSYVKTLMKLTPVCVHLAVVLLCLCDVLGLIVPIFST